MTSLVWRPLPQQPVVIGVVAVGLYVVALSWGMQHWPYDYWAGIIIAPALLFLTWPILTRVGRAEDDNWLIRVMLLALVVKMALSIVRYVTIFDVYEGTGDASVYDGNGRRLAPLYWAGQYGADVGWPHFIGAGFIIVVTAIIYMIIGPTIIGGFLVYTWLSFLGLVLAYRAFRLALPEGDHRRYAVLLFFFPSLLFWPSSIGKDAWMGLCIGLCLYGAARLLTHRRGGFPVLILGLSGALAVRPHVAALCMAGIAAGYLLRAPARRTSLTPLIRVSGLIVIFGLSLLVIQRAAEFVGVEEVSVSGVTGAIDNASVRTARGESYFQPAPATNPANLPKAVMTVLYRPYLYEAHNTQSLIAAAEGLITLMLTMRWWRQIFSLPRLMRREPYVTTCVVLVVGLIVALSSFSNFGILARERAMMWPAFLALLCVPVATREVLRHGATPRTRQELPQKASTFA